MLDRSRPVLVHRTFGDEPGLWTLTQDDEVVGFLDELHLTGVTFVFDAQLQAKARVTAGGRVVYAWARGTLAGPQAGEESPVRFDGKAEAFVGPDGPLVGCAWISFRGKRVSAGGLVLA